MESALLVNKKTVLAKIEAALAYLCTSKQIEIFSETQTMHNGLQKSHTKQSVRKWKVIAYILKNDCSIFLF